MSFNQGMLLMDLNHFLIKKKSQQFEIEHTETF